MISDRVLERAVAQGLIQPDQAVALRDLARQEAQPPIADEAASADPVDEERIRSVTGFADIFVTIGLGLFLGAATFLIGRVLVPTWGQVGVAGTSASIAAMSWLLAEFFTRIRRMALPSIALLVSFAAATFMALAMLLLDPDSAGKPSNWLDPSVGSGRQALDLAAAAIGTAVLTALHYLRFRVPITVAAGTAALGLTILMLLYGAVPAATVASLNAILLGLGLAIFALAMRFDVSDPQRRTRRTDIAFWLHILASPLIVHSVFQLVGAGRGLVSPGTALGIIGIFLLLAVVAVLVDRRAMLVSGLVYVGFAFGSLFRQAGMMEGVGVPTTLLVLGSFVLLLSAGWQPLRAALLRVLPPGWAARLPARVNA